MKNPNLEIVSNDQLKPKNNKLDFRGHSQRFPNSSLTKICSFGSSHDAELSCKNISQKIKPFWKSSNLISRENFGPKLKNQTVKLLETTESICCFYKCLSTFKKSASQFNSALTSDLILRITLGMPRCTWPHPYEWNESYR